MIIIIQIVLVLFLGLNLPDDARIPAHWNLKGEIDRNVGKWTGILFFPLVNIGIILLFIFLPYLSIRYKNAKEEFAFILHKLSAILIFVFSCTHIYTLLLAKGTLKPSVNPILSLIGLIFIYAGFLLSKVPSNFYVGIRTPWTLSSENVWKKTQKVGGICFILGGILMSLVPLIRKKPVTIFSSTFVLVTLIVHYPVLYSFVLYKRKKE